MNWGKKKVERSGKRSGKRSEWIGEDNRKKVYTTLTKKPSTFGELLDATGLSTASLTGHIRNLQKDNRIERMFENGKRIYHIRPEKRLIELELLDMLKVLAQFLSENWPDLNDELLRVLKVLTERIAAEEEKRRM